MKNFLIPDNSMNIKIPYQFLHRHIDLKWRDIYFGLLGEYIDSTVAIEKAIDELENEGGVSDTIASIAIASEKDSMKIQTYLLELIPNGIMNQQKDVYELKYKWLYLFLLYLYENKEEQDYQIERSDGTEVPNIYEKVYWLCSDFSAKDFDLLECFEPIFQLTSKMTVIAVTNEEINSVWLSSLEQYKEQYLK